MKTKCMEIPPSVRLPRTPKELLPQPGNAPRMVEYSALKVQPPAEICLNISLSESHLKLTAFALTILNTRPQHKPSSHNFIGQSLFVISIL
jgi:hypothetical protein